MGLAFWRARNVVDAMQQAIAKSSEAVATPAVSTAVAPKPVAATPAAAPESGDLDLRSLGHALIRKRNWIIAPAVLAAVLSIAAVNMVTPRYKSEARILVDGRENVFPQPSGERSEARTALDAEAVMSQVQLLLSRDLAREIIQKNRLAERPEFDPVLQGLSPLQSLLALCGIGRDLFALTPEERVLEAFYDRYTAYAVDRSRVVVIEFQSRDPELAARVANSIAESYLVFQQGARQQQAKSAGQRLSSEIESLRKKVAEAESRVEDFRSRSSLLMGTNNTSLSNQQIGEINTQLNDARALKSDADSRARQIKETLESGKPIDSPEVLNSELVRRLSEQRVMLRAQLAGQSSTLLDRHPRIKELRAQLADLDRQLREEADKASRSLENHARIAGDRVEGLIASLDQLKKQASSSNGQDMQLRALEREAKAQRDLLESYLAKYRVANAGENIEAAPADGRIISRATVSNTPAYPNKLPIVLIATLATLLLASGAVATGELRRTTAPRASAALMSSSAPASTPSPPTAPSFETPDASAPEPGEPHAEIAAGIGEIEQLADDLVCAGEAASKVTVLGTASSESITLTALTLARLMARQAKVVFVDLAPSSPTVMAVSVDPLAPGLAELMQGEASFGQIITRDRLSRLHLVSPGRPGYDRAQLQSLRLTLAMDALLRVYDHVLLDAGAASDLPAELLTSQARAVVVPDPTTDSDARSITCDQFRAVGFFEVTMLSEPCQPTDAVEAGPRVAAA
jgi:succinoglycan biosynthesis transport protein ExoP